ncbi:hypothetical protein B484DRAFT_447914 [Ochromonadaceae sp. CCMP2298]|nr:hypothetical protein B484DRAFT_447914 [Ochromonadaceae sp. CCMP2298]
MNAFFSSVIAFASHEGSREEGYKVKRLVVGHDIHLSKIDGSVFTCFVLVPIKNSSTHLVKCKYILAVTECQIAELYPHPSKLFVATSADVHELEDLVKLRFKRDEPGQQGQLVLQYKSGKVLTLMVENPAACAECLRDKMQAAGMVGRVKTQLDRRLETAAAAFAQASEVQKKFEVTASLALVRDMMDLLRLSAEKFEESDADYRQVNAFIKGFLSRPDVKAVLESADMHESPLGACPTPIPPTDSPPVALSILSTRGWGSRSEDSRTSKRVQVDVEAEAEAEAKAEADEGQHQDFRDSGSGATTAENLDAQERESGQWAVSGESGSDDDACGACDADDDLALASVDCILADDSPFVDCILDDSRVDDSPFMGDASEYEGESEYVMEEDWQTGDTWAWEGEAGAEGAGGGPSSPCELSALLDEISSEFDAIVQSFTEVPKVPEVTEVQTEGGTF